MSQRFKQSARRLILLAALCSVGCDSVNTAAARNEREFHSNPDAQEQAEQSRKRAEAEKLRRANYQPASEQEQGDK